MRGVGGSATDAAPFFALSAAGAGVRVWAPEGRESINKPAKIAVVPTTKSPRSRFIYAIPLIRGHLQIQGARGLHRFGRLIAGQPSVSALRVLLVWRRMFPAAQSQNLAGGKLDGGGAGLVRKAFSRICRYGHGLADVRKKILP